MRDFNVNPKNYLQAYHTNGTFSWKFNVLHHLESKNLIDTVDLYQDITTQNLTTHLFLNNKLLCQVELT